MDAFLPEDYIPDAAGRIEAYKRIAAIETRICKSRIAMRKPEPKEVNSRMAESRLAAISVNTLSRGKGK